MMADFCDDRAAAVVPAVALAPEHVGQRQAGAEGADLEEVAARDAVAEALLAPEQGQHGRNPLWA